MRWMLAGLVVAISLFGGEVRAGEGEATASPAGRVIVLPGIYNTRFHLRGFVRRVEAQLPGYSVEVRRWGIPLVAPYNLAAESRNRSTAAALADEIVDWRRAHPDRPLYLVGYSGGGGIATLVVSALPDDVSVDRLVLVAPAISPDYALAELVLPKVDEFVVNFASERDLQVGWGTRTFGTIDRVLTDSAGAVGFALESPELVEWHWSAAAEASGHRGNHLGYLGSDWQDAYLLPALDPSVDLLELRARLSAQPANQ